MSDDEPLENEDELEGDEPLEVTIRRDEAGERIDKVLAARDLGFSRSTLQRFLNEGRVAIDGRPADRRSRPKADAVVRIEPSPPPSYDASPEDIPLDVLFEDAHLLVLDKRAGMVVHPAPGHAGGTLVNALLHHTRVARAGDAIRPGIVHRLDKDTSGVMVVAKTSEAHERLVAMFQRHDLERRYRAIAIGDPPDRATYDTFHHRHPVDRKRFTSRVAYGRRAITHVETVARAPGVALIECRLETGRTHQIRVHAADHGHPLLGDPVYGGSVGDPFVRAVGDRLGRQALHAAVLSFAHPITGVLHRWETEPPEDFRIAWSALTSRSN